MKFSKKLTAKKQVYPQITTPFEVKIGKQLIQIQNFTP